MIAGIDRRRAVAVDAEHHRMGMARPVANDPRLGRQAVHQQVAPGVMGVLDDDLGRARLQGALAGGDHLGGHQLLELGILGLVALGLGPAGDACRAFHVGADEDFHSGRPCLAKAGGCDGANENTSKN